MQYDTRIANSFGTDVGNPYFVDEVVRGDLRNGSNRSEFICDDDSVLTVVVPDAVSCALEREGKSLDDVDLDSVCAIMVTDCSDGVSEPVWYRPVTGLTARDQYLENHEDVRACRVDTYSRFAYDEYVSAQAVEMFEHCMDVVDRFRNSGRDFDASAYDDVMRSREQVLDRITNLGIVPYYTDFELLDLDIMEACCQSGLVMSNADVDAYVDSYRDVYEGDEPDTDSYRRLSSDEERRRAMMCASVGMSGVDLLLDAPVAEDSNRLVTVGLEF